MNKDYFLRMLIFFRPILFVAECPGGLSQFRGAGSATESHRAGELLFVIFSGLSDGKKL